LSGFFAIGTSMPVRRYLPTSQVLLAFRGYGNCHSRQEMIHEEMQCSVVVHDENMTTAMYQS